MKYHAFFKQAIALLFVIFFTSCDNDSNEIGTNIIGEDNFATEKQDFPVTAEQVNYGVVQSTNLPVNLLGVYDNPVFGRTTANFITQVQLADVNPTIDLELHPTIVDVTLSVPYFSKLVATGTDGISTYTLDSIIGNKSAKLNLKIYRSRAFLGAIESTFYNNDTPLFDGYASEDDLLGQFPDAAAGRDAFEFSPLYQDEVTYDSDTNLEVTNKVTPRLTLKLNAAKFNELFATAAGQGLLLNNTVFKEYFRGLYFKTEKADSSAGVLGLLNFAGGKINIRYTQLTSKGASTTVNKLMVLNMTGNTVNLIERTPMPTTIANPEQKLVLQGGAGSMIAIDLFPNGELAELKKRKLLVNDASLTFYVDTETMDGTSQAESENTIEPERIYLYDLTTNAPIVDYYSDQSANTTYPNLGKTTFGGIIEKNSTDKGFKYKIKLTNHIIRLLGSDETYKNVKLGLVVTKSINVITNSKLKESKTLASSDPEVADVVIEQVPSMSVIDPAATVLWGSGDNVPEDKRLKLQIYYTKPN